MELYPVSEDNYSKLNFTDLIGIEQDELLKLHTTNW